MEANPGSANDHEILARIAVLGGVPLRPDRTIDVQYFACPMPWNPRRASLATDGTHLYAGDIVELCCFEIASQTWTRIQTEFGPLSDLAFADGKLWVATQARGLWQQDVASGKWTQIVDEKALPSTYIDSLAVAGGKAYLGVGLPGPGRLVEIDRQGQIHVFDEALAPSTAPTYIVVTESSLFASTLKGVHEWSFASKSWLPPTQKPTGEPQAAVGLFDGKRAVWASTEGHELFRWGEADEDNVVCAKAWYRGQHKRGYRVNFVAEQGKYVWFGGEPREPFSSSGLFRLNLANGALENFGPGDGFRARPRHCVYDGLWLDGRLWLLNSDGLCAVTERK
jgi:hypothetical protein